ncbi:MAG: flippase-like domain-containing protein, partial [Deltaproteobacteria bacterium]|nr:flippase-like domain-containing protein [Deltaproteobacteria bacterium]
MKPKAIFIKLGITLTLVAILGYMVDFGELRRSIAAVSARALLTAVLGYALTQVITSTKWYVLLQAAGVKCTLARTIKAVFIGMYVNTFCFGTIGGDLVRSLLVSGNSADKGISLASVVADRVMGLSVLAGIGILSGLFFGSISEQPDIALVATVFIVLAGLGW